MWALGSTLLDQAHNINSEVSLRLFFYAPRRRPKSNHVTSLRIYFPAMAAQHETHQDHFDSLSSVTDFVDDPSMISPHGRLPEFFRIRFVFFRNNSLSVFLSVI